MKLYHASTQCIEDQTYKPLTEEVRNDMTIEAREQGLKSWDQDVNRFIDSTRIEQYDPVNTWLDHLPEWDGHDHIADLAARVPTTQPHWPKYLRYWLMGMVGQWRESDKQLTGNALTPLLIGRQGCGKTRFCKNILPPVLRDYYNDKLNFKNEFDLNIALTMFALINLDEFDKTTKSQQIVLKYLLSSSEVKFRPPYGKTIKQFRRYTSFIGTTNEQLYAQALHLFNNKERFWLDDEEIKELIAENEPFQKTVDLVDMIDDSFAKPKGNEGRWWKTSELHAYLDAKYAYFDAKVNTPKVLGRAMNNYKFGFKRRIVNGISEYWLQEK